jgi:hypothetical protein
MQSLGSHTVTLVPCPTQLSRVTRPPWASVKPSDYWQSKTGSLFSAGDIVASLAKAFEHALLIFGGDTDTAVPDAERKLFERFMPSKYFDGTSPVSEFDCIRKQVEQDLP